MKYKVLKKKIERFEFDPKGEKFILACCDCGLTHNFGVALEKNGKIGIAISRNQRQTIKNRNSWKK